MQKIKNIISPHDKDDYSSSSAGTGNTSTGATTGNRVSSGSYGSGGPTNAETRAENRLSGNGTSGQGLTSGTGSNSGRTAGESGYTGETSGLTGADTTSGTGQREEGHGLFGKHEVGHNTKPDAKFDPSGENVTHEHQHLQHVTHRDVRHQEVEEVERQRDHHRHVHHLQHHVQPVVDRQVQDEVLHNKAVPTTNISEQHANTTEDKKLFASLGERHRDQETHRAKERTVVDLGERVNETVHHHVHHVTQPVVEQEIVDRHKIHTVIPLTHTVHEAPIIHKSSVHEPVHMSDFLKGGGKLDSGISYDSAGVLQTGDCSRTVDGIGEKLTQELNLKPSTLNHAGGQTQI